MQEFDKDYNAKIRARIKKYRKLRGYSQELLAEKIDRTREHINKIENGKQTVVEVLDVEYNIPVQDEIFTLENLKNI